MRGKITQRLLRIDNLLVYKTRDGSGFDLRMTSLNNSGVRALNK